jgi:CRP-like cAMP-binding protein
MGWDMASSPLANQLHSTRPPESQSALASALERLGTKVESPRGSVLFQQGRQPTRVLVLRKGKVRLSRNFADGHRGYRTVGPGRILGLLATVSNQPYLKTAETLEDCEVISVDRNRVVSLLDHHPDLWLQAVAVVKNEIKLVRR